MADSSKHLIYLLPDVAYVTELIPGKDEFTFTIKDYLQVNGDFMNDKEILGKSLKELIAKIKPNKYDLVLPDFLFTNTVVNISESGEAKVKEHLETKIIPDLKISDKTHNIQHFILTEHKDVSKVQLSALEHSVLSPFKDAFDKDAKSSIGKVYPLSWTIKSLISLEPSISLAQMGSKLYLAQHYIGVDQANYSEISNTTKLIETIKTLKGAEPSIQSLYLLSNELVEKNIKDGLKDILPIQQLSKADEESEMPSYVKQIIEAGVRTMVVPDFKLPEFSFDESMTKASESVAKEAKEEAKPEKTKEESFPKEDKKEEVVPEVKAPSPKVVADLPTPTEIGVGGADDTKEEKKKVEEDKEEDKDKEEKKSEAKVEPKEKSSETTDNEVDLSQFSPDNEPKEEVVDKKEKSKDEKKPLKVAEASETKIATKDSKKDAKKEPKKIIKNKSGVNNMVKMVFVGLVSFFITVGVGLGLGLGFLNLTNKEDAPAGGTEQVSDISPTTAPTVVPTAAPVIDRTTYDVLVVNATTKAGYAGIVKSDLEDAGFESVDAKNSKGEYDQGYYVLLDEEDESLINLLEEDTGLSFEFSNEKQVEDPNEEYDFVVVLGDTE